MAAVRRVTLQLGRYTRISELERETARLQHRVKRAEGLIELQNNA
jgi:hypothetical protein